MGRMEDDVNPRRRYHAPRRRAQAKQTRADVLAAAHELFTTRGYVATTVGDIAAGAGVAVDTVYAAVGRKPALLRELLEAAISGTDHAVPAEQRDYVRAIRAATTAREKITRYAAAVGAIGPRTAPINAALRDAATNDADCAALWQEVSERRAANMLLFAADLRGVGGLRTDLSDREVADIVWSMSAPEYYLLLVEGRGWSPQHFADHLADAWCRLLLAELPHPPDPRPPDPRPPDPRPPAPRPPDPRPPDLDPPGPGRPTCTHSTPPAPRGHRKSGGADQPLRARGVSGWPPFQVAAISGTPGR